MEEYEKRFAGSSTEKTIKRMTEKSRIKLRGINDERGALYAETAKKEIIQRMRQEMRSLARGYFRMVSDIELICRKYRALGACDTCVVDAVQEAFESLLSTLKSREAEFSPLDDWEKHI